ncbi:MAG TPA: hypothetical protein DCE02_04195 [Ruminiclostridium sp.]|uniref:Uncharacterized protein n=1 Tax=Acetivibrio saccincola TaxID=1677857 RepID=A0A2K9E050_9FIRM|nr:hypothetical protein [Acetivibrio saccincola]HAA43190.1 hypothetical protein [Ruminiclostridium sp.]AUG57157.1 hypothetical protein HVS_06145 [Acetivibrio saccincola]AUG58847.1 hypothetical protein HVS_14990 [Acetivibrio saccincola]NLW26282.1 hypothetical protein [Acetivibrio saccincola]PQQ66062.1 hypothetical protein B9R14_04290 [Acetivibrio saccincola]
MTDNGNSIVQLDSVTKEKLARLLYMSHMKEPLDSFKIDSLMNEYAYLCHDDGTWTTHIYAIYPNIRMF